jgi:4-amino-4-deoxy-L-arabinose transferase
VITNRLPANRLPANRLPANRLPANRRGLLLAALLTLLALSFQGTRGLWEPDEGRYATVALNMLDSGDWLVPRLDREHPHLSKPPLAYWAIAASVATFGRNEWAVRLPMALAFVLTGLLVHALGHRLVPDRPALPALAWGLSLLPFTVANIASTDGLLALFTTLAMFGFVAAWASPPQRRRGWLRLMWLGFGLAFLTKGPPGLLPLLAVLGYSAFHDRRLLRQLFEPLGLLLFALVAFSWFAVLVAQDAERLRYLLGYEVVDRIFTTRHDRNGAWYGPVTVYLPTLLAGALPWWPLALVAAGGPRGAWRRLRDGLRSGDRGLALLAWWLLLPLAIFCLARSRLPTYLLPLWVPLALSMARPLASWPWLSARRLGAIVVATAVGLLAVKGVAAHRTHDRDARAIATQIAAIVDPASIDEIVFVTMRPQYGARFYLDKEVEGIQLVREGLVYSRILSQQDLCEEFAERERNVYAMKRHREAEFRRAAANCGTFPVERLGEYFADGDTIAVYRPSR